ncbi:armadillo-like helical domain-containing protein 4 isoform X2 [Sorex araneus]|uniref:armadillo-like helical domain-containing protein 4 isoform X2 n=1 Tax=Sorex araneus TaxID=42254 RepID=UPI0024334612|nr:armadillo-like helical domain-containing protein 4 isoform X2 [Sorex araneus]
MNKQQSEAPSPWRSRRWGEPRPLQGPPRGCRARAPLHTARCSAEGAQGSISGIVTAANLCVHCSSTMNRPVWLHICLAFCSLLLLNIAAPCLAFPNIARRDLAHGHAEKRQSESMITDEPENSSVTSQDSPQLVVIEALEKVLAEPSAASLHKALPVGTGLMQPSNPSVNPATEPVIPVKVFASSHPLRTSPESRFSKAVLTSLATATASLNIDKKEAPFSATNIQPLVKGSTEATQDFLKYVHYQTFATESQEGISLGHSPSSYMTTKEMLTTKLQTKKPEAETEARTPFPSAESMTGAEPGSLMPELEEPLQMTADDTQSPAPKFRLATEYTLSAELETDSLLGAPEVTVSVSTAVPAASVINDEWDDTKLEPVSQIKTPKLGDNAETQGEMETSQTAQQTNNGKEGDDPLPEVAEVSVGQPEGETQTVPARLMVQGKEGSPTFTHQSSFTPTSFLEDLKVSAVNSFQNIGDFTDSTKESSSMVFLETTVSISDYTSGTYQPLRNTLQDTITQEMTTAVQEEEATLSSVTEEQQVSTQETAGENGETEEGKKSLLPTSAIPGDGTDTVTRPSEEFFTPVLDSPGTPPGITEEPPSIFPALLDSEASSETRTILPSIHHVNTAASYGLDQLESEEGEDEDEEDEEEEDEDEEDEEDDEEDKDADSLDEGLDSDGELPGFTLPGLTSEEPSLEQRHASPVEGITYQMPDSLQWEQQNQGLVRSWMEKLKDKAGYMSGMLVPVGVGIAGALFILGALYSIKVMNRRRRNGFKRHKRKQREFNSMQDRVMLLADSSEDEF